MNRQEEFLELKQQLTQLPPELEGTARRAQQRAHRRRMGRRLTISFGSLAGVCAAFMIAVNTMPTFAVACGRIPVLRELAAAVAFSPSLAAAVEHDYVQYVGQTQTIEGVEVTVEYVIADAQQIVVFYRTDGPASYSVSCGLQDGEGRELQGYSVIGSSSALGFDTGLKQFEIHCKDLELPETLVMKLKLWESYDSGSDRQLEGSGTFQLHLNPEKTAKAVVIPVEQWIELDGQRLLVDRLELTPTRTLLYLDHDPGNTAWLQSLDFWFTTPDGTIYDQRDGAVTASGDAEHPGFYTYYFQSLYFTEHPERLTLQIGEAVWLDKAQPTLQIDLTDGAWTRTLPQGVTDVSVERLNDMVQLVVTTGIERMPLDDIFTAPDGSSFDCRGYSYHTADGPEEPAQYFYNLTGYDWDTVTASLSYTEISAPEQPVTIVLS